LEYKESLLIFEYDQNKSIANKQKHGIDFEEAKELFTDENAIIYPSSHTTEERFFAIGLVDDKIYTAIITFRGENIRIISTRRARKKELEQYERLKNEKDNS